jgi:hypothetical protein
MPFKAHHAVNSLFRLFMYEYKHLAANQKEMEKLADSYFLYGDLLRQKKERTARIVKIYGVLGVHSPDVSKEMAKVIEQTLGMCEVSSRDIRNQLKLWEILEVFLWAVDNKATVSDFKDFLYKLDIREGRGPVSAQAINSAVKAHPELFDERLEGGQKFLVLKSSTETLG